MTSADQIHPSRKEFLALAKEHTLVPVCRTLTADLETPVSAFLRAAWAEKECFLLESVEGGEQVGRYTFIGLNPYKRIVARGRQLAITEGKKTTQIEGDVFAILRDALGGHKPARLRDLPPFSAGAVGYFAYDAVRQIEKLPETAVDELKIPDACLLFFDEVLAFDHVRKQIWLVVTADVTLSPAAEAYDQAVKRLNKLEKRLSQPLPKVAKAKAGKLKVQSRTRKKDYIAAVAKTKEYIAAGDAFQVVLSQRFDVEPGVDSFQVYRALRNVNPSPYMFFLRFATDGPLGAAPKKAGKKQGKASRIEVAGSSPELLVRVHGRKVEYRPIAGTRPRGTSEKEDQALADEMMHDEKERAEHVMLVDLGRNDVGRVSEYGSVKVDRLMFVERYSHVMHIVSSIEGTLRKELTAVDALRACFPAGTLSGAPKVRAMEIIEELEPARRGTYGGAVLYADFSGNLDSCIAIRSLMVKDGKGSVQAGAGIVADSVPELEYQESINKASAVIRAVERAREL
ncbi:anthranilate synthase component I [Occallatibacter riparius]|uniref:Anthranilate synthase component 1 n=1 Tax=Occallatibacter riparius TaxID=1002689 RepID=A0A9J7BT17_9BACT|nr:anthranilate synthase component I [Occallatibacter riparius]UWZ84046.1 anthranilate synthase component I [Occallatibacter riparius]